MTDVDMPRPESTLPRGFVRRTFPGLLTLGAMVAILLVCGAIQPRIWSQGGMTLIMSPIVAYEYAKCAIPTVFGSRSL